MMLVSFLIEKVETRLITLNLSSARPSRGEPPFNVNRFSSKELTNKLVTKKLALNPRLNFIGNQPEQFELFSGLGRFNRTEKL